MSLLSTIIPGSLLRLIAFQNRSQLLYPSDSFVGIIENCEYSTKTVPFLQYEKPCIHLHDLLYDHLHKAAVCNVIIKTAAKPVLNNICVE
jgi:hypothetical protein